jgi:hypothetical protein
VGWVGEIAKQTYVKDVWLGCSALAQLKKVAGLCDKINSVSVAGRGITYLGQNIFTGCWPEAWIYFQQLPTGAHVAKVEISARDEEGAGQSLSSNSSSVSRWW